MSAHKHQDDNQNQDFDSDLEFEKPKDEHMFFYKAFKSEEKKMISHVKFEQITAKYWQLLRNMTEQDIHKSTVSQKQYTELMKRVYKALLPLYKQKEMESEIAQEWIFDSRGLPELTHNLLTKVLFRIAHWWCTHIDIDEYIDLLEKVYKRIINKFYISNNSKIQVNFEHQVSFPIDEKKFRDNGGKIERQMFSDDWLECQSNESNKSDYDYKYEEDPDKMVVKKFKRVKADASALTGIGSLSGNNLTIRDPFLYEEEVIFSVDPNYAYFDQLKPLEQVYPFGFFAEKFMTQQKQFMHDTLIEFRMQVRLNAQGRDDGDNYKGEKEAGLLPENGVTQTIDIAIPSEYHFNNWIVGRALITDAVLNQYRKLLREGVNFTLRMYSQFPKPGQRTKARSGLTSQEPIVEHNRFGYNPCLDRRVMLKLLSTFLGKSNQWINIQYMIELPDMETAYRADVNRIETKAKMAIKDNSEDIRKDEDFNCVEASYKKMRHIMLFKKFESIYHERKACDNKTLKRLQKVIEKEDKRRQAAMKAGNIAQKGLTEQFEEKSFIKMMRGPFFQLDSREGLRQDDFYTCATQDLIDAARQSALRVLLIGKPRSGKTTLAKNLAQKLDLVHINVDNWIAALLKKIKEYEPPEVEEGQEPPKFLSDLEEAVHQALQSGQGPTDEHIIQIIFDQIHSPQAMLKGYILDLSFYQRESSWASTIRKQKLLGEFADGRAEEFTHVVELLFEDDDVKLRAQNMRVNPEDGVVYSRWELEERKKPKPPPADGEEAPEEDEENAIKPLDELALIQRSCDTEERIKEELVYYNTVERPAMEELLINFYENQYIKIDAAGLTPDELTDTAQCRLKLEDDLPLRPLAIQIEGAGDFKSLLTEGLEENELPRKWSLWNQIDPVALIQGKVVQGAPEYACHYSGNVFVFSTEENLKAFIAEPKSYLQERPYMPNDYRILMLGPKGSGKHTQATYLNEIYGWRVIDYKELVRIRLEEMMKQEVHIPNNPMQGGKIGLSEPELQEVIEGKAMPAWKFIPWIFDELGFPLEKRKPLPPDEKQGELEEEEIDEETKKKREAEARKKAFEEEKKRKEEEEHQKQKEEKRRRREEAREQGLDLAELGLEDSEEEPIIIEDLSIDQLVLKVDEQTGKAPHVGGFILIGFPETEEQMMKLKAHGIDFDSIIYLKDNSEDDQVGVEIKKRMKDVELYDYDYEVEASTKVLGLASTHFAEENASKVKEVPCIDTPENVFISLRKEIDPFYVKVDNPENNRVSADLGEEDKKLPKGDFGDYCPVTYVNDNWLFRGSQEFEFTIHGKTYWLAGEKEAKEFEFNPIQFLKTYTQEASLPLQAPPPKIMVMGHRGAGTTSLIRQLCEKYKLDEFNLKQEYFAKLKEEKEQRKRRRLLDRGFRPPQPPEEEGMEPPADPEIEDDPEGFDREGHERQVMKMILDSNKGLVIDGTWRDIPEGSLAHANLQDLLFESRRMPEIVIILKCKEQNTFDRIIDSDSIKAEYERLMEKRAADRLDERQKARAEFLAALEADEEKTPEDKEQDIAKWDEDRDAEEEAAEENDPEKPNLDEMLEKEREVLRETRTNDDAFFEEFSTALKDKQVFVIDNIKSDNTREYVFLQIMDRIKDNIQYRKDLIERQLAQPLKPEEVKFYEKSYIYKHSKYGENSPLNLGNPAKSKKHTALYRERLYFLSDQDELHKFLKEPSKYTQGVETVPLDLNYKPKVVVIGLPKSGRSTLCKILNQKTGIVHLKMSKIIEQFISQDSVQGDQLRKLMKGDGRAIEDDLLVSLLLKRIQMKDCQRNGWILEDFPKTKNQAVFLAKKGLVPTTVICMRLDDETIIKRTRPGTFGAIDQILQQRISTFLYNTPHLIAFYQRIYNNVIEIDSKKSHWFIEDMAITEIKKNMEARQTFARDYHLRDQRACKVKDLHLDRSLLKQSLSEFRYYCPVTWKNEKLLVKCQENIDDCVLFKNFFYYFQSQRERDIFLSNPGRFLTNSTLPHKSSELPLRMKHYKAAEVTLSEKAIGGVGYCPVTLMDEDRVVRGDNLLLVVFRDAKYIFESEFKLQRFMTNPGKYSRAQLPVKMPPPEDKVTLYNLQRMEDSIAFMEQALGQIVTKGLREVAENRLKYPTISVKETMLKLFALFLKTDNPANTESMKRKYAAKMKQFIQRCELPEEIFDLAMEKEHRKSKDQWPEFKENYYNDKGAEFDAILKEIEVEKQENFVNYIR